MVCVAYPLVKYNESALTKKKIEGMRQKLWVRPRLAKYFSINNEKRIDYWNRKLWKFRISSHHICIPFAMLVIFFDVTISIFNNRVFSRPKGRNMTLSHR